MTAAAAAGAASGAAGGVSSSGSAGAAPAANVQALLAQALGQGQGQNDQPVVQATSESTHVSQSLSHTQSQPQHQHQHQQAPEAAAPRSRIVRITNIHPEATLSEIQWLFSTFGPLVSARLVPPPPLFSVPGIVAITPIGPPLAALLAFEDEASASAAVTATAGGDLALAGLGLRADLDFSEDPDNVSSTGTGTGTGAGAGAGAKRKYEGCHRVVAANMVTAQEVEQARTAALASSSDGLPDLLDDIGSGFSRFGALRGVELVPAAAEEAEGVKGGPPGWLVHAYFDTLDAAQRAVEGVNGRFFACRRVYASFHPKD